MDYKFEPIHRELCIKLKARNERNKVCEKSFDFEGAII